MYYEINIKQVIGVSIKQAFRKAEGGQESSRDLYYGYNVAGILEGGS